METYRSKYYVSMPYDAQHMPDCCVTFQHRQEEQRLGCLIRPG